MSYNVPFLFGSLILLFFFYAGNVLFVECKKNKIKKRMKEVSDEELLGRAFGLLLKHPDYLVVNRNAHILKEVLQMRGPLVIKRDTLVRSIDERGRSIGKLALLGSFSAQGYKDECKREREKMAKEVKEIDLKIREMDVSIEEAREILFALLWEQ